MSERLNELRRTRAQLAEKISKMKDEYVGLVQREADVPEGEEAPADLQSQIEQHAAAIRDHEERLGRLDGRVAEVEKMVSDDADAAGSTDDSADRGTAPVLRRGTAAPAQARKPGHETDRSLVIAGCMRMLAAGGGSLFGARAEAQATFGERHPVTRALVMAQGPSGGFIVPPDYVAELIDLLRPQTVVRGSGARVMPMPRGTMTLPRQSQAATASYGGEVTAMPVSQQTVDQIVLSYKKLTALVPISNDLMRYSDPSIDAIVRDDLAQVLARKEDIAFIRGDGTAGGPVGFRNYVLSGNTISSTSGYSLSTVAQELGGAVNKLETSNVPIVRPVWILHPRAKNYLLNVQNSNGFYVYREEMTNQETLLGIPFKTTTQIPINLTVSGNSDCTEVYLAEMSQAIIADAMTLELAVSREGTYVDASNNTVSVFQSDQTLIRAIAEHDFALRHNEAVAIITGVRWAPAIS